MFAITMQFDLIVADLLKKNFTISLSDFKTMRTIYMLENPTQQTLAQHQKISEAAISKRVLSLIQQGLIIRKECVSDKRGYSILLSDKGTTLMKKIQKKVITHTEMMLSSFSEANRILSISLLNEIYELIEKNASAQNEVSINIRRSCSK